MRNLDECRSEILRLGKEKIKERKKRRKHMILACAPVCLCVAVAAAFLPYNNAKDGVYDTPSVTIGVEENELVVGTPIVYLRVELKGYGDASDINNRGCEVDKINHIAGLIEQYFSKNNMLNGTANPSYVYGDEPDGNPSFALPDKGDEQSGYLIVFKTATDYTAEYTLTGYTLRNNSTNESVFLTIEERTQLLFELTHVN